MSQSSQARSEIMERRFKTLDSLDVAGKRVIVRVDINVPMKQGKVQDATRINRIVPTIEELVAKNAKVIVISHFDRPKGRFEPSMSLAPLVDELSKALGGKEMKFAPDCIGSEVKEAVTSLKNGEVILLENLRFHAGEESNDEEFGNQLAALGDIYVNDAFSCSHRAHASIVGIAGHLESAAGRLMQEELDALETILGKAKKPVAAIVGGAKISTKLKLLENLIKKVDYLIIGGGMANTFLLAKGYNIGKSLCEDRLVKTSQEIMEKAEKQGCQIILPVDAVCAEVLEARAECEVVDVKNIPAEKMVLDVGPKSTAKFQEVIEKCKTILWNGPVGAFETSPFDVGTIMIARMVSMATSSGAAKSIAGGGDTVSSLASAGVTANLSYISTAGGAFLEWIEGDNLPGVEALYSN